MYVAKKDTNKNDEKRSILKDTNGMGEKLN